MDKTWFASQIEALETQKTDALRTIERCEGAQQICRFALGQIEKAERENAVELGPKEMIPAEPAS